MAFCVIAAVCAIKHSKLHICLKCGVAAVMAYAEFILSYRMMKEVVNYILNAQSNIENGVALGFPSELNDGGAAAAASETVNIICALAAFAVFSAIVIFLLRRLDENALRRLVFVSLFGVMVTYIADNQWLDFTKSIAGRPRPYEVFNDKEFRYWFEFSAFSGSRSMPSGHSCGFWTAFYLPYYFKPERQKARNIAWGIIIILGIMVMLGRMIYGCHFLTDVTMGAYIAVLGAFLAGKAADKLIK